MLFLGVGAGMAIGYAFAGDIASVSQGDATAPAVAPAQAPQPAGSKGSAGAAAPAATPAVALSSAKLELAEPFQQRLLSAVGEGGKVRVGVFGDSFGDGVWAALYHQLPRKDGYEVEKFSRQSTGFTRYASLNLEKHLAEQLAEKPVDIAVISFGANDTQGVMRNGKYAALLSEGWKAEIGERIDRYVAILRQHGAVVFWVGLPVMRKASYDADIAGMSAFFAERMQHAGVPFIDTRSLSTDASGGYADYLPDSRTGKPRLMRANDGIHMSMNGYERLTGGLAKRIRNYVAAARQQAERAPAPVSAAAPEADSGA